jgi:four helix bundle protein
VDRILIRQLMRSATSVGANYRAALRAKSKKDFLYKINIVEEEADECYFWLELIAKAEILQEKKLQLLLNEANELTAIFTAQGRTTKLTLAKSKQALP